MKKLIALMILAFVAFASFGQSGQPATITQDTIKGNENVYFTFPKVTGTYDIATSITATRVSTAAGGTAYFQASIDGTNYVTLTPWHQDGCLECWFGAAASDSVCYKAFADVASQSFMIHIEDSPFTYYRWFIDGDVNDTMIVAPDYVIKKK